MAIGTFLIRKCFVIKTAHLRQRTLSTRFVSKMWLLKFGQSVCANWLWLYRNCERDFQFRLILPRNKNWGSIKWATDGLKIGIPSTEETVLLYAALHSTAQSSKLMRKLVRSSLKMWAGACVRVCKNSLQTVMVCVVCERVLCRCLIKTRNKIQSMSIILGMCEKRTVQIHGVITSSYCVANGLGTTTL